MAWRLEQSAGTHEFLHSLRDLVVDIRVFKYCVWPRVPSRLHLEFKITLIVTALALLFDPSSSTSISDSVCSPSDWPWAASEWLSWE